MRARSSSTLWQPVLSGPTPPAAAAAWTGTSISRHFVWVWISFFRANKQTVKTDMTGDVSNEINSRDRTVAVISVL